MTCPVLHVFKDTESGIESHVFFSRARGDEYTYGVSLIDVDASETLPYLVFFKDEDKAIAHAKAIARVAP